MGASVTNLEPSNELTSDQQKIMNGLFKIFRLFLNVLQSENEENSTYVLFSILKNSYQDPVKFYEQLRPYSKKMYYGLTEKKKLQVSYRKAMENKFVIRLEFDCHKGTKMKKTIASSQRAMTGSSMAPAFESDGLEAIDLEQFLSSIRKSDQAECTSSLTTDHNNMKSEHFEHGEVMTTIDFRNRDYELTNLFIQKTRDADQNQPCSSNQKLLDATNGKITTDEVDEISGGEEKEPMLPTQKSVCDSSLSIKLPVPAVVEALENSDDPQAEHTSLKSLERVVSDGSSSVNKFEDKSFHSKLDYNHTAEPSWMSFISTDSERCFNTTVFDVISLPEADNKNDSLTLEDGFSEHYSPYNNEFTQNTNKKIIVEKEVPHEKCSRAGGQSNTDPIDESEEDSNNSFEAKFRAQEERNARELAEKKKHGEKIKQEIQKDAEKLRNWRSFN